jgi:hypothetical protein
MLGRCVLTGLTLSSILLAAACSDEGGTGGGGGEGAGDSTNGPSASSGPSTTSMGSGTSTATGQGGDGTGGGGSVCPPLPLCDAQFPDLGQERDWVHTSSSLTAASGFANHRGRDMFYNPGDDIWVMAKFAYGVFDDDIKDEDVDVYLNRECGSQWESLGTVRTTEDGEHPTTEGVEDTGGWVFFKVPPRLALGEGRHRFLMAVGGDLSTAEVFVDIVKPGTPLVVSDVDGTLTTTETEEFSALLTGSIPDSNPDSPAVLSQLAEKGYRVFYMTARPHFLVGRTREFVETHGYPPGLVHTSLSLTGATGSSAVEYKSGELAMLAARGLHPAWAFGNTDSDAEAYENGMILPLEQRIMFQFDDTVFNARTIDAYAELLPEIGSSAPPTCP